MKISRWHDSGTVGTVAATKRNARVSSSANDNSETHYIVVDGETFARLEGIAARRKLTVRELVDYAIHRALDSEYLRKARG